MDLKDAIAARRSVRGFLPTPVADDTLHLGPPQWADLGMFLQNLMLLAVDEGLATCPQEAWAMYPTTVEGFLGVPADRMLFCGVAIGIEDRDDPANRTRSERAPSPEWLSHHR